MVITQNEYLQLVGLETLAQAENATLERIRLAALAITRENEDFGHTADMILGARRLDEALGLMGITVEGADA